MPDQSPANPLTTLLNTTSAKDPGRACFLLHVRPEVLEEYVDVHQRVWEEMRDALTAAGWRRYSLFLNPDTGLVVGYFESSRHGSHGRHRRQHPLASRDATLLRPARRRNPDPPSAVLLPSLIPVK